MTVSVLAFTFIFEPTLEFEGGFPGVAAHAAHYAVPTRRAEGRRRFDRKRLRQEYTALFHVQRANLRKSELVLLNPTQASSSPIPCSYTPERLLSGSWLRPGWAPRAMRRLYYVRDQAGRLV